MEPFRSVRPRARTVRSRWTNSSGCFGLLLQAADEQGDRHSPGMLQGWGANPAIPRSCGYSKMPMGSSAALVVLDVPGLLAFVRRPLEEPALSHLVEFLVVPRPPAAKHAFGAVLNTIGPCRAHRRGWVDRG